MTLITILSARGYRVCLFMGRYEHQCILYIFDKIDETCTKLTANRAELRSKTGKKRGQKDISKNTA